MTWKFGLLPIVDSNMAVNIKNTGLFGGTLHPFIAQFFTPFLGTLLLCKLFDFTPQDTDLWHTIQPNQLAPLSN